jgi:hypothetical protein
MPINRPATRQSGTASIPESACTNGSSKKETIIPDTAIEYTHEAENMKLKYYSDKLSSDLHHLARNNYGKILLLKVE